MNIMNKVTLKGLLKNRTRTIVTIIGVILSTSMITAVTTFISSLQNYVVDYTIAHEGDWHGVLRNVDIDDYSYIKEDEKLEEVVLTHMAGYANLKGSANEYKPYLRVLEVDDRAFDVLPIKLNDGRLPQKNDEVLVSEHTHTNGGVEHRIGDKLVLELGDRVLGDGTVVTEKEFYFIGENQEIIESLDIKDTRTFTVVGIMKRLSYEFEPYSDPGYTLITKMNIDSMGDSQFQAYMKAKNPRNILSLVKDTANELGIEEYDYNKELLRYMGISNDSSFNRVLYSLGGILIALIMVGSISLIYNSFSISISERIKQFGLLSSVGATSIQCRNSVFFESIVIAGIGIPLGVVSGIGGIGTTLYLLRDQLNGILYTDYSSALTISVSVTAVISAAILALVTILISAYIPARRSKKISAMDAIRQTTDIKLTSKKVRTSRLTRKLFGLEGDIALKNLKRNRLRYRSTVISLFISVVLFVSASAFGMYLKDSVNNVYEDADYDITYTTYKYSGSKSEGVDIAVYKDFLALDGIDKGSIIKIINEDTMIAKEYIIDDYYQDMVKNGIINDGEDLNVSIDIFSVDHDTFIEYINELGLEETQLSSLDSSSAIIIDNQHYYNGTERRYNNKKIIKDKSLNSFVLDYMDENGEQKGVEINVGAYADITPFGGPDNSYFNSLIVIIDENQLQTSFADIKNQWYVEVMYFASKDSMAATQSIKEILIEEGLPLNIFNVAEEIQNNRNIITIITVFAYGFVVLISLITIANVFNTISTNVNLRRREFAMLKSVGMTNSSFNKMLNYECVFYGLKALLYGIPASIGVTYLIYKGVENGVDMGFYLPTGSVLISIFSVFIVVFISMMYSMSKIRKENILDGIRNENL